MDRLLAAASSVFLIVIVFVAVFIFVTAGVEELELLAYIGWPFLLVGVLLGISIALYYRWQQGGHTLGGAGGAGAGDANSMSARLLNFSNPWGQQAGNPLNNGAGTPGITSYNRAGVGPEPSPEPPPVGSSVE